MRRHFESDTRDWANQASQNGFGPARGAGIVATSEAASAPGVTRTPGQRFRKPLLYPPELQGQSVMLERLGTYCNIHFGRCSTGCRERTTLPSSTPG